MEPCTCAEHQSEDDCVLEEKFCASLFSTDGISTTGVNACSSECDSFSMEGYVPVDDGTTPIYEGF